MKNIVPNRRVFLSAAAASFLTCRGLFAEQLLLPSPSLTEGPFYPDKLPLDLDNDLIRINDNMSTALGEISWVSGRVMDRSGTHEPRWTAESWRICAVSSMA